MINIKKIIFFISKSLKNIKKEYYIIFLLSLVIFLLLCFLFVYSNNYREFNNAKNIIENKISKLNDCSIKESKYRVNSDDMFPLISKNKEIKIKNNFYKCWWNITRWDVVLYNSNTLNGTIISRIQGIPWDKILTNKEKWYLFINWNLLKNSKWKIYIFKDVELAFFELYSPNWILQDWAFLIFWDNIWNITDSRKIWAVSDKWFIWKIIY